MTIDITIAEPYQSHVPPQWLEAAIDAALTYEHAAGDVTLVVTDNDTIADLNESFLGHKGPTDVLSFPSLSKDTYFVAPPDTAPYLGDIIIAYPYVAAQAKRLKRALSDELALLVVHGILHLLGYDHTTPEEKSTMWKRQDAILANLPPLDTP